MLSCSLSHSTLPLTTFTISHFLKKIWVPWYKFHYLSPFLSLLFGFFWNSVNSQFSLTLEGYLCLGSGGSPYCNGWNPQSVGTYGIGSTWCKGRGLTDLAILNRSCLKVINYATSFTGVTYTLLWCPLVSYTKTHFLQNVQNSSNNK